MRIFWYEVRKLLRPGPLLAALVLLLLFERSVAFQYLHALPKDSETGGALTIYADWRERYGTTLDPEELPGVRAQLDALCEEADSVIAHWDETKWEHWASFSDAGISNYEEYAALLRKPDRSQAENDAAALLLDSRTDYLQLRIALVENVLEHYDFEALGTAGQEGASERALARAREIAVDPALTHSILYSPSLSSAQEFAAAAALVILAVVAVIVSPVLVRERLCRMMQMQWATRTGRRIARYRLAAALAVSAAVSAGLVLWYGVRYARSWHAAAFWDCMAYAVGGSELPWFSMTYGQYLVLLGVLLTALGVACGVLMCFLSRFSGNYIAMLLKALPGFLALAALAEQVFPLCLYFGNRLSGLSGVPGTELTVTAAVLAGTLLLAQSAVGRDARRELPE